METLIAEVSRLLNETLCPGKAVVSAVTEALDRLSRLPDFPLSLLSIATGGESQGQRMAAATYLKNFTRRYMEGRSAGSDAHREFRNRLVQAALCAEPAVLKILVEALRFIVVADFVKENSWPELVPELKSVIQNSNLMRNGSNAQWKTINALTILQTTVKPFQYFLDPQLANPPVPMQLEIITEGILEPLQNVFHHFLEKTLLIQAKREVETEQLLLITCKCIYFAVRSYMPSALRPILPSFCWDLYAILDSLNFDCTPKDGHLVRLKTGKRCLIILCALVTRHRKHVDKLLADIINCTLKIVNQSSNLGKFDYPKERIVSLAFDVIAHVLKTGHGWKLVSPHFSSLLESAIFPALVMNEKDISEWEGDAEEYIRKNLPSELDDMSEWTADFFTARKSAISLLGIISISKGSPVLMSGGSSSSVKRKIGDKRKGKQQYNSIAELLVIPFLSKFPIPSDATAVLSRTSQDYYGVLMAYGSLQDFLRERNPEYVATLVRSRVMPLYSSSFCLPYLVASANWVLGQLASCLPQEMSADIYYSLLKALTMPDLGDVSCYPVRASAAGAVAELVQNGYVPPDWLPLLQVVIKRTTDEDGNESSLLYQLLCIIVEEGHEKVAPHSPAIVSTIASVISKFIPPIPEPWPQIVEWGFTALAKIAKVWEDVMPDEDEQNQSSNEYKSGWSTIARTFSGLLQQAWLRYPQAMEVVTSTLPPPSCLDDASVLLEFIIQFVTEMDDVKQLKIAELLLVWADMISDWDAWEEVEDIAIFHCIQEAVHLHEKYALSSFFPRKGSASASSLPQGSIIEGFGAFISKAMSAYPSATLRACSCVHLLLHFPKFSFETECIKQTLAVAFTSAAFSRFKEIRDKPVAMWRPLLLVIASCYLCYPEYVEKTLEEDEEKGFMAWISGLTRISSPSFCSSFSSSSENKLAVFTLVKILEWLLESTSDPGSGCLRECFISLIEASIRLKEVQEEEENEDAEDEEDDEDEETDDYDEDSSEDDVHEETEQEFLDRYAQAANAIECETVLEGDVEDEVQELELGTLVEVDPHEVVLSLIEKHHQLLLRGGVIPPQLKTGMLDAFPECDRFFQF